MTTKDHPQTLKELREAAGLSQDKLARCIGVTGKTISNWERGISIASLTIPQIKALCKTLNLTLDELPDDFSSEQ
jgi:transcriptional regulator with XRE-family HTH domain